MGAEVILGIVALVFSAAISATGGAFWIQLKGSERIEKIRKASNEDLEKLRKESDSNMERFRKESDDRVDRVLNENKAHMDVLLTHVQKVENVLNNMRAELPTKYVLRDDFIRLVEKVEEMRITQFRKGEG